MFWLGQNCQWRFGFWTWIEAIRVSMRSSGRSEILGIPSLRVRFILRMRSKDQHFRIFWIVINNIRWFLFNFNFAVNSLSFGHCFIVTLVVTYEDWVRLGTNVCTKYCRYAGAFLVREVDWFHSGLTVVARKLIVIVWRLSHSILLLWSGLRGKMLPTSFVCP